MTSLLDQSDAHVVLCVVTGGEKSNGGVKDSDQGPLRWVRSGTRSHSGLRG